MLTQEGCRRRRERLWESVPPEVEWLLIADPRHVNYLANFWVHPLSFSGGERGLLLLERDGPATLFADNFARRSAAEEPFVDNQVIASWYDHRNSVTNRDLALFESLSNKSDVMTGGRGLVEREWCPDLAIAFVGLELSGLSKPAYCPGTVIRELRRAKHDDEIALLKLCMRAGDAGHARAREVVRPGITEQDVFREVQSAATEAAGRPVVVYGDFRATNAEVFKAGGLPTDYRLQDGDLFILDYSVVINGYRSDFTNTIAVTEPTDDQQRLCDVCVESIHAGEAALKSGVAAADVYRAVSGPMEDAGYDPLGHHAGHGIGLAHPEPPILVPESRDVLVTGDVVTLEPGMYLEGIGGMRFEHNYLITEFGFERLSDHVLSLKRDS